MSIKVEGLGSGEVATLLELENFIKEKLILLEETGGTKQEKFERLITLKNMNNFISNYKENCKSLDRHVYEHRFDKYDDKEAYDKFMI